MVTSRVRLAARTIATNPASRFSIISWAVALTCFKRLTPNATIASAARAMSATGIRPFQVSLKFSSFNGDSSRQRARRVERAATTIYFSDC